MDPTILRQSWARIARRREDVARRFYDELFAVAPALRPLFAHTTPEQQRVKFMDSLEALVRFIETPEQLAPYAAELGRRHAVYGALDEHYALVGSALVRALDLTDGLDTTPDERHAWQEAYTLVAAIMRRAALMSTGEMRAAFPPQG